MHIELDNGQLLHFPIKGNPLLENATDKQLNNVRMLAYGVHWPDLDEHLSIEGILKGDYGQRLHAAA